MLWFPNENVPSFLDCDELDLVDKILGRLLGEFQIKVQWKDPIFLDNLEVSVNNHFFVFSYISWCFLAFLAGWPVPICLAFSETKMVAKMATT